MIQSQFTSQLTVDHADEMFAIFDIMNHCTKKCHIETIGIGKVMSAGTLNVAGGTKGNRKISKNCRVMLHQVSAGACWSSVQYDD